ncbi:MAG: hypothetical protein HC904_04800 [Blastochloris sp.]|nr:hypothetical protein [Blastochloris sp.]
MKYLITGSAALEPRHLERCATVLSKPVPLDNNEVALEIEAVPENLPRIEELPGVLAVHPCSDLTYLG